MKFQSKKSLSSVAVALALTTAAGGSSVAHAGWPIDPNTTCAADPWETETADHVSSSSWVAVGSSIGRAMCQVPTEQPRYVDARDVDYVVFDGVEGRSHIIELKDLGSRFVNYDGSPVGIYMSLAQLHDDGSSTTVPGFDNRASSVYVTEANLTGRILVTVWNSGTQVYDGNVMDIATLDGSDSGYTLQVTETAPVNLESVNAPTTVRAGEPAATGTVTLAAPAPAAGVPVYISSSDPYRVGVTSRVFVPGGARTASFEVKANRVSNTTSPVSVTITAKFNSQERTDVLTYRRAW